MKYPIQKTCLLAAALSLAPMTSQAAWTTFGDATGWNNDVIYGPGESGLGITSSIDSGPGQTGGASFYTVTQTNVDSGTGLPNEVTLSQTGSGASFVIQPYNANNSLMLAPTQSGTLTLAVPTSLTTLALFGDCGNGDINGTITIHYQDGTSQTLNIGAVGQDWFFNDNSVAYTVGGRQYDDGGLENDGDNPRVYEQLYTTNSTSPVVSVDINDIARADPTGAGGYLSVLAISGDTVVPEPSAALLTASLGLFGLARRRRA